MKVYIAAAKRTAIGSLLGSLKTVSPSEMGAEIVKSILCDTKLSPDFVDEVITGNVLSAGLGQCVSRQISIGAKIPDKVPCHAVNMVCGSGMRTVIEAYLSIKAGYGGVILAGGVESMSRAPMLIPHTVRSGIKMGNLTLIDSVIFDALTDSYSDVHMGVTAENIAERFNITREMQDEFAYNSQQKAIKAVDERRFKSEIVPIDVKDGKNEYIFETDEYPNRTSTPEKLSKLRPAFKKDGTVTAGNASGINDGASFVLIAGEDAIKKHGLKPMVEIMGIGQAGVDPQFMGLGPVPAIAEALKFCGQKLSDIDVIELNEAFAAQSLGVIQMLEKEHRISAAELLQKTNMNGGAIALGHPVGASGNRIIVTLIHEMLRNKKDLGLASLCIGGGMGTAVVLKRV